MANQFLEFYRQHYDDPRPDDIVTMELAQKYPEKLQTIPDFGADVQRIQQEQEQKYADILKSTAGEYARTGIHNFVKGLADVPKGVVDSTAILAQQLGRMTVDGAGDQPAQAYEDASGVSQFIDKAVDKVTPEASELLKSNFWVGEGGLTRGLGAVAGFIAGGELLGAAGIPEMAATTALGAATAAPGGYEDAVAHGATNSQALTSFMLNGGVGAAQGILAGRIIQRLNLMTAGKFEKSFLNYAKSAGTDSFVNAFAGFFQQAGGNEIAREIAGYDEDRTLLQDAWNAAAQGGAVGVMSSVLASAIGHHMPEATRESGESQARSTEPETPTAAAETPKGETQPASAPKRSEEVVPEPQPEAQSVIAPKELQPTVKIDPLMGSYFGFNPETPEGKHFVLLLENLAAHDVQGKLNAIEANTLANYRENPDKWQAYQFIRDQIAGRVGQKQEPKAESREETAPAPVSQAQQTKAQPAPETKAVEAPAPKAEPTPLPTPQVAPKTEETPAISQAKATPNAEREPAHAEVKAAAVEAIVKPEPKSEPATHLAPSKAEAPKEAPKPAKEAPKAEAPRVEEKPAQAVPAPKAETPREETRKTEETPAAQPAQPASKLPFWFEPDESFNKRLAKEEEKLQKKPTKAQVDKVSRMMDDRRRAKEAAEEMAAEPVDLNQHPLVSRLDFANGVMLEGQADGRGMNRGSGRNNKSKEGQARLLSTPDFRAKQLEHFPVFRELSAGQKFSPELGDELTRDFSPEGSQAKQITRRVTAFQNADDGGVLALGTYKQNRDGQQVHFVAQGEGKPGRRLEEFMAEKGKDGKQLWQPIASMQTTREGAVKGYAEKFASREEFEKRVADPARRQLARARELSDIMTRKGVKTATNAEGVTFETNGAEDEKPVPQQFHEVVQDYLPREKDGTIKKGLKLTDINSMLTGAGEDEKGATVIHATAREFFRNLLEQDEEFRSLPEDERPSDAMLKFAKKVYEQYQKGIYHGEFSPEKAFPGEPAVAGEKRSEQGGLGIAGSAENAPGVEQAAGGDGHQGDAGKGERVAEAAKSVSQPDSQASAAAEAKIAELENRLAEAEAKIQLKQDSSAELEKRQAAAQGEVDAKAAKKWQGKVREGDYVQQHSDGGQYEIIDQAKDGRPIVYDEDTGEEHEVEWSDIKSIHDLDKAEEIRRKQGREEYRIPQLESAKTSPQIQSAFANVVRRLAARGVDVHLFQKTFDETVHEFFRREGGAFDKAVGQNIVALVLNHLVAPSEGNLRTALHETSHYLLRNEEPAIRDAVLKAIEGMTDEQLRISESEDARIRQSNPEGWSPSKLATERLAESMALNGVENSTAKSLASRVMDFVKGVFLKAAINLQKLILGEKNISPRLALEYYENRFRRFTAPQLDFFERIRPPTHEEVAHMGSTLSNESIPVYYDLATSSLRFGEMLPETGRAAILNLENALLHKPESLDHLQPLPSDNHETARLNSGIDIAANNEVADTIQDMFDAFEAAGLNKGADPHTLESFRGELMRIRDPKEANGELIDEMAKKGLTPADRDSRTKDLPGEYFCDMATRKAVRLHNKLVADLDRKYTNAKERIGTIDADIADATDKEARSLRESKNADMLYAHSLEDFKGMVKDLKADMRATNSSARKLGMLRQTLRQTLGLKGKPVPAHVERLIDKLASEIEGDPMKFTDMMLEVAKLPIDWIAVKDEAGTVIKKTATTGKIREVLAEEARRNPLLEPLAWDTDESRAFQAMVISFARSNNLLIDKMKLRGLRDIEEQGRIQEAMEAAFKGDLARSRELVRSVAKHSELATRMYDAYRKDRKAKKALLDEKARLLAYSQAVDAVRDTLRRNQARLEFGIGSVSKQVELIHGGQLLDPLPTSTAAEAESRKWIYSQLEEGADPAVQIEKMRNWEAWLQRQPLEERGSTWNTVNEQLKKLKQDIADKEHKPLEYSLMGRVFGSISDLLAGTGTAGGRSAKQRILRFVADHDANQKDVVARGTRWQAAHSRAQDILGVRDRDVFNELFYDRPLKFFENHKELSVLPQEKQLQALRQYLESESDTRELMENKKAWLALRDLYLRTADASGGLDQIRKRFGLKVKDETLGGYRESIGLPLFTTPRVLDGSLAMLHENMKKLGWNGTAIPTMDELKAAYESDPAKLTAQMKAMVTPEVWDKFVRPMAYNTGRSLFYGPEIEPGVWPLAARDNVVEAFERSTGDPVKFAENLFDLEGTGKPEDKSGFVAETLDTLYQYYKRLANIHEEAKVRQQNGLPGVPHQLMDARISEDFPAEWLKYQQYDPSASRAMLHQMTLHSSFGRDMVGMNDDILSAQKELKTKSDELAAARREVGLANPTASPGRLRYLLKQKLGKEKLAQLENAEKYQPLAHDAERMLKGWYASHGNGIMELRPWQELVHAMAGFVVQGPRSALMNTLQMFDPIMKFGLNKTSAAIIAKSWQSFLGETFGSFVQTVFGHTIQVNVENVKRRLDMGRYDIDTRIPWRERVSAIVNQPMKGSTLSRAVVKASRVARETLTNTGIGRKGEGKFVRPKPLAPFSTLAAWMNAAAVDGHWWAFEDMVARAARYVDANPTALNDPKFKFTPEMLGHGKGVFGDARPFHALADSLANYAMTLETLTDDYIKRRASDPNASLLTPLSYQRLATMPLNEINMEANITNRPLSFYTNPVLRFSTPLLGWSVAKMEQLRKAFREPGGELRWRAVANGALTTFAGAVPLSLAYAYLMKKYDQDVTGKKSDIRDFGEGNDVLAAIEQTARLGTFGMYGDLANTALNFASGGDLRGISADSRTLFLNGLLNSLQAIGTFARQGTATYATVYRPLIQSLGGSGYLQYAQIINHLVTPDIPGLREEAKVTARINALNYLRTEGRALNLDVRTSRGGASLPTEVKPWVTEMALAAYSNDPVEFQEAYRSAVAAAKDEGKPDPVDYVKRSFQYQHPLRTVFRTPPSEAEYHRILAGLDDDGRQDVGDAVRLFNAYGQRLGITPYDGKGQKATNLGKSWLEGGSAKGWLSAADKKDWAASQIGGMF